MRLLDRSHQGNPSGIVARRPSTYLRQAYAPSGSCIPQLPQRLMPQQQHLLYSRNQTPLLAPGICSERVLHPTRRHLHQWYNHEPGSFNCRTHWPVCKHPGPSVHICMSTADSFCYIPHNLISPPHPDRLSSCTPAPRMRVGHSPAGLD